MFYDRGRWCSGKIDWHGNTHSWGKHNVKVEFYVVTWLWSRDGWYKKTTFLFTTQCQICPQNSSSKAIVAIVIEIVQKFRFFVHFLIEFRQVLQSSGKYFT